MILAADKLKIFVSSTLHECKEERNVARQCIESLNHQPVMFEAFGARSHTPRSMYQRGIEESHIFVAIYRNDYGWIADNMNISGIEDEYQIASRRGMDRLIYVYENESKRSKELATLIRNIMNNGGVTIAFYNDPQTLADRIKDDLTSTISGRFLGPNYTETLVGAKEVLDAALPNLTHRIRRAAVENELHNRLATNPYVVVNGPLGIGKTTLLVQAAIDRGWVYIDGRGKLPRDVIGQCVNALAQKLYISARTFVDLNEAIRAFDEMWSKIENTILVIDNFDETELLGPALTNASVDRRNNKVIVGTRLTHIGAPASRYAVPAFSEEESKSLVMAIRGIAPDRRETQELMNRSGGNPLYLRYYASGEANKFEFSLQDYEIREWSALPPLTKEALSYVALSEFPMSLGDLSQLISRPVEETSDILRNGAHLLRKITDSYELFHDHFRMSVLNDLVSDHPKHAFYAARLGNHLNQLGDFVSAFMVLDRARLATSRHHLNRAAFTAFSQGDVNRGIHIFSRKVEISRNEGDQINFIEASINLARLMQDSGDRTRALVVLEEAGVEAEKLNDPVVIRMVRESRFSVEAWALGSMSALTGLRDIRKELEQEDDVLGVARLSLNLSAACIRTSKLPEAADEARIALEKFKELNHEEGIILSKANLASALSAISGRQNEMDELLAELNEYSQKEGHSRYRALICNLYARRYRREKNLKLSEKYSLEAMAIGLKLGDQNLTLLNQLNLANAYRDENLLEKAMEEYTTVARESGTKGYRQLEATASRLISSIYNTKGTSLDLAIYHADYALGLVRDTADIIEQAECHRERGRALQKLGRSIEASDAYATGAKLLKRNNEDQSFCLELLEMALFTLIEDGHMQSASKVIDNFFLDNTEGNNDASLGNRIAANLGIVVGQLPLDWTVRIVSLIFRVLISGLPRIIARPAVMKLSKQWIERSQGIESDQKLLVLASLLAAAPIDEFKLLDIVEISERLCSSLDGINFKPRADGAAHWTIKLNCSTPVLCTIDQLDDRPEIALASLILSLLLKGLEKHIESSILLASTFPRSEASIMLVNVNDFTNNIDAKMAGLPLPMSQVCTVSRASNPAEEKQVPIVIICRDDISKHWEPGHRRASSLQIMFGLLLTELIFHLLKGAVDLESLRPKIIPIVAETVP